MSQKRQAREMRKNRAFINAMAEIFSRKGELTTIDQLSSECGCLYWCDNCPMCRHRQNLNDNCLASYCPLIRLASLADIKDIDEYLYNEYLPDFKKEHEEYGTKEDDFLLIDYGDNEWVIIDPNMAYIHVW